VFFTWHEKFAVGHPEMDAQHRRFLETLNTLYGALQERWDPRALRCVLDDLDRYARDHFAREEALLREVGYPGLDEQIRQHGFFRRELAALEHALHIPVGMRDLAGTLHFMRDWFLHHVLAADRRYRRYLEGALPMEPRPRS